ncbi:MAG: hypothetical protein KGZ74_09250 [Chitinophagaceae bacterium]|nr:hypothetical protein [Chitinophagaceae bacterium]
MLYKRAKASEYFNDSSEGEHTLLYSNKWGIGSPSLQFLDTSAEETTEEMILEYLAQIIISIHFKTQCRKKVKNNASSIAVFPQKNRQRKETA